MSADLVQPDAGWEGVMETPRFGARGLPERRKRARTRLHWQVVMFRDGCGTAGFECVTRDLSSGGFYCLMKVLLHEGEQLDCSIQIPTHDPAMPSQRALECRVRVVRVVPQVSGDLFGIAFRIEDYHLARHTAMSPSDSLTTEANS